jgi:hypothetical protein
MQFDHRSIKPAAQDQLAMITSHPSIAAALRCGGYFAGGFPRYLARGGLPLDYLDCALTHNSGDIDIFFPTLDDAMRGTQEFLGYRSFAGFCSEKTVTVAEHRIKVQLVNHPDMIRGNPEACVKTFDFKNCAVWMHGMSVMVPDGWDEIEEQRLLDIQSVASPFLGGRIIKYLRKRGYLGLTSGSRNHIKEWMLRAARGEFDDMFNEIHLSGVKSALKKIVSKRGLIDSEDLSILIGLVKTSVKDSDIYGLTREVDLAMHTLERRQNG